MMQIVDLSYRYPQSDVFANLSFDIPCGVTLVQGGDGRGKTTLLRLLAGDLKLQSGRVSLDVVPGGLALNDQPEAYRQQVFWVDPRTTTHDPIKARTYLDQQADIWPGFDRQGLPALIEGLSLTEFLDKPLYMLSTGSKRKVWLAAAFASHAAVALLDDPFAALDKPSIRFVTEVLQRVALRSERAVVMTGYDAPDNLPLAGLIDLGA
jgi:ABC-type multidrug transport system ATPase subunit